MRSGLVAAAGWMAVALMGAGCSGDELGPCEAEACNQDCEDVGYLKGQCSGSACVCTPVQGDVVLPWCDPEDPDGHTCANDRFLCVDQPDGGRYCLGQYPAAEGESPWWCMVVPGEQGNRVVQCTGEGHQDRTVGFSSCTDAVGLSCREDEAGLCLCVRPLYTPAEGGPEDWTCWYAVGSVYLTCERGAL